MATSTLLCVLSSIYVYLSIYGLTLVFCNLHCMYDLVKLRSLFAIHAKRMPRIATKVSGIMRSPLKDTSTGQRRLFCCSNGYWGAKGPLYCHMHLCTKGASRHTCRHTHTVHISCTRIYTHACAPTHTIHT